MLNIFSFTLITRCDQMNINFLILQYTMFLTTIYWEYLEMPGNKQQQEYIFLVITRSPGSRSWADKSTDRSPAKCWCGNAVNLGWSVKNVSERSESNLSREKAPSCSSAQPNLARHRENEKALYEPETSTCYVMISPKLHCKVTPSRLFTVAGKIINLIKGKYL